MSDFQLKILFFTVDTQRGGAERVISLLCNGEIGKKNELYILSVLKGQWVYELPGKVKRYGILTIDDYYSQGKLKSLPFVCRKYYAFVKKICPDMIIAFLPEPCFIAGFYRKALGIPVIGSERGNPYYQFRKPIYRIAGNILYNLSDGFVFQTEGARDFFISRIQKRSVIIGNPISHDHIPYVPIKQRRKEIVAIGRFTAEKNYPLLIRAFARVLREHPDYKLRIYGKYTRDDETVMLIKDWGLAEAIILEGPVDNIKQCIADAYAYVLTSFSEGLPNALMEAMSVGLPVVATDCQSGGPRQLIRDGVNGVLVPDQDEDAIVEALNHLIENPSFAEQLGSEAREIEEDYSEEKISSMWMKYIQTVRGR